VVFVSGDQFAEVLQPADFAFDFVPPLITPQRAAVLQRRFLAAAAVRADQFDAALLETLTNPVGIESAVIQQSFRLLFRDALIDERFCRVNLSGAGRRDERRQGRSFPVDHG
jgi:hypothetical protein